METPKLGDKPYKKIVPLKGKFLAKLKKEFQKELSINGKQCTHDEINFAICAKSQSILDTKDAENGVSDATITHAAPELNPAPKEPLKSPENKIIIQKVENVKIELIKNSIGPARRLSSLFNAIQAESNGSNVNEVTQNNDETQLAIEQDPPVGAPIGKEEHQPSLKLLSAKIPENNFNRIVPLKLTRIIRKPKPQPNLSQRYHRVETFKPFEIKPAVEPVAVDFTAVEVEALIPDIQMSDDNRASKAEFKVYVQHSDTDSGEDFMGFASNEVMSPNCSEVKLINWLKLSQKSETLKDHHQIKNHQATPIPKLQREPSAKSTPIAGPAIRLESSGMPKPPEIKDSPVQKIVCKIESLSNQIPSLPSPEKLQSHVTRKLSFSPERKIIAQRESSSLQQPSTSKTTAPASTATQTQSKPAKTTKQGGWQDDILAVIGATRISEIDKTLKDIPNIPTGNTIELENVEQKLIINHLLRLLKVNSVMETLKLLPSGDLLKGKKTYIRFANFFFTMKYFQIRPIISIPSQKVSKAILMEAPFSIRAPIAV